MSVDPLAIMAATNGLLKFIEVSTVILQRHQKGEMTDEEFLDAWQIMQTKGAVSMSRLYTALGIPT